MADPPSTSLVSDAEIEAALAEARAEEFPSLDDNTGKSVVVVPVPGPALRPMPAIAAFSQLFGLYLMFSALR